MDAEAYPEDAEKVLNILWEIGSSMQIPKDSQWTKARVSALMALGQYEVLWSLCVFYIFLLGVFLVILVSFGSEILNIYIFVQFRYIFLGIVSGKANF